MIKLIDVSKSYDDKTFAVRNVSLHVLAGELFVLLGASGCGKTTTMKLINRLMEPTAGHVEIEGQDVRKTDPVLLRRHIGYVFQSVGLFPHMTVGENTAVIPCLLGWPSKRVRLRVDELLEMVELPPSEFRDRMPRSLSGGQQQRVGLARALAGHPKIMLMDEPFGALDPISRDLLQTEYKKIHESLGLTTIMVTHDMAEALLLADRIAVMQEGRFVQVGTPRELLSSPANEYVEQLLATSKRQADRFKALSK